MGCATILRLKGHITAEQIVGYIDEHYKLISDGTHEENYGSVNQLLSDIKEKYEVKVYEKTANNNTSSGCGIERTSPNS